MLNILWALLVLGAIAIVFGVLLSVSAKVFEVEEDPRLGQIESKLAGANCGGCGYPGCAACAAAILAGKAGVGVCVPAGADGAQAIAEIMGVTAEKKERMVSHVRCSGGKDAKKRYHYVGIADCIGAGKVAGGPLACEHGCLGFGNCVAVCRFDAIHINERGVAEVDREKCTNCGTCRAVCPRKLIVEVPYRVKTAVSCADPGKGAEVMKLCARSCIGCGLCAKTCPRGAITIEHNLPVIDYAKCTGCTLCAKACPRDALAPVATAEEKERFRAAQKAAAEKRAAAAKTAQDAANTAEDAK